MTSPLSRELRLYSPHHVLIATAIGGPFAGAFLVSANYRQLAEPRASNTAIAVGVFATASLLIIGWFLPANSLGPVVVVAYAFAAQALATKLQGQAVAAHTSSGGLTQSRWRAAGIGAVSLAGMVLFIALAALVVPEDWLSK
jgi:hypothetical protein